MFHLDRRFADEMIAHARAEDPNECCGLLAGRDGKMVRLYRVSNSLASPTRYLMEPRELLGVFRELDDNEWEVLAVYHSHSHTPAYPSPTDLQLAHWPEPLYIIISLEDKAKPVLRAFHIKQGQIQEEEVEVP